MSNVIFTLDNHYVQKGLNDSRNLRCINIIYKKASAYMSVKYPPLSFSL